MAGVTPNLLKDIVLQTFSTSSYLCISLWTGFFVTMRHNRKLINFFYQFNKFRDDVTKFVHKFNQAKFSLLHMHEKIMHQYANIFSVSFIFSLAEISSSQGELPTSFCNKNIVHCFLDLIESKRRNKTHCIKKFRHIKIQTIINIYTFWQAYRFWYRSMFWKMVSICFYEIKCKDT